MIPAQTERTVHAAETDSARFGISAADSVHLMTILRDTLYSDKVLAVIREYSANAWDAACGTPIEVTLPTHAAPVFTVRDRGPGLPHDGVMRHFTQYGASSKRASNDAVGYLGIGCKSGFAYADSFTVTSWHDGRKRVYAAIIDASGAGEMRLLDEEDCGDETSRRGGLAYWSVKLGLALKGEKGLAVSVPVRPRDVSEFVDKARDFYRFFDPQPLCNYNLSPPVWGMRHGTGKLYAVMGCVAYPIDLLHIRSDVSLSDKHGAFRFDIGALDVAASREALKYSDRTKAALTAALTQAHQNVVAAVTAEAAKATTDWDRRLAWQAGAGFVRNQWTDAYVELPTLDGIEYRRRDYTGRYSTAKGVTVRPETRLVIRDTTRRVALSPHDTVARSTGSGVVPQQLLLDGLALRGLSGIPIVLASSLPRPVMAPAVRRPRAANPHPAQAKMFHLIGDPRQTYAAWAPVEREPTDDDVYVVLRGFRNEDLRQTYHAVKEMHDAVSAPMPVIYGYRGAKAKTKGTSYEAWRRTVAKHLVETNEKARKLRDDAAYADLGLGYVSEVRRACIPVGHPVRVLLDHYAQISTDKRQVAELLLEAAPTDKPAAELDAITERWPLLKNRNIAELLSSSWADAWVDYLKR